MAETSDGAVCFTWGPRGDVRLSWQPNSDIEILIRSQLSIFEQKNPGISIQKMPLSKDITILVNRDNTEFSLNHLNLYSATTITAAMLVDGKEIVIIADTDIISRKSYFRLPVACSKNLQNFPMSIIKKNSVEDLSTEAVVEEIRNKNRTRNEVTRNIFTLNIINRDLIMKDRKGDVLVPIAKVDDFDNKIIMKPRQYNQYRECDQQYRERDYRSRERDHPACEYQERQRRASSPLLYPVQPVPSFNASSLSRQPVEPLGDGDISMKSLNDKITAVQQDMGRLNDNMKNLNMSSFNDGSFMEWRHATDLKGEEAAAKFDALTASLKTTQHQVNRGLQITEQLQQRRILDDTVTADWRKAVEQNICKQVERLHLQLVQTIGDLQQAVQAGFEAARIPNGPLLQLGGGGQNQSLPFSAPPPYSKPINGTPTPEDLMKEHYTHTPTVFFGSHLGVNTSSATPAGQLHPSPLSGSMIYPVVPTAPGDEGGAAGGAGGHRATGEGGGAGQPAGDETNSRRAPIVDKLQEAMERQERRRELNGELELMEIPPEFLYSMEEVRNGNVVYAFNWHEKKFINTEVVEINNSFLRVRDQYDAVIRVPYNIALKALPTEREMLDAAARYCKKEMDHFLKQLAENEKIQRQSSKDKRSVTRDDTIDSSNNSAELSPAENKTRADARGRVQHHLGKREKKSQNAMDTNNLFNLVREEALVKLLTTVFGRLEGTYRGKFTGEKDDIAKRLSLLVQNMTEWQKKIMKSTNTSIEDLKKFEAKAKSDVEGHELSKWLEDMDRQIN